MSDHAAERERTFLDESQRKWRVYERRLTRPSCGDADLPAERILVFDAGTVLRRVSQFPDDWHALSAVSLEALSWGR